MDEEYNEIERSTSYSTPKECFDGAIDKAVLVCNAIQDAWNATGLSYDRLVEVTKGDKPHIKDGLRRAYETSISKEPKDLRIAIEKLSGYIGVDKQGDDILNVKGQGKKDDAPDVFEITKTLVCDLGKG